jgi:hypothetical protein
MMGYAARRVRMVDERNSHDLAGAWALLYEHPALMWIPPLWRAAEDAVTPEMLTRHAVRAVERNLLVNVRSGGEARCVVRLSTGPLEDRALGDGVDPVSPSARRDERLDVEASTFEDALCALARRVVEVYGPPPVTARSLLECEQGAHLEQVSFDNEADRVVALNRPLRQ